MWLERFWAFFRVYFPIDVSSIKKNKTTNIWLLYETGSQTFQDLVVLETKWDLFVLWMVTGWDFAPFFHWNNWGGCYGYSVVHGLWLRDPVKFILATFFFNRMFHGLVPFRINPFFEVFCQLELGNCTISSDSHLSNFFGTAEQIRRCCSMYRIPSTSACFPTSTLWCNAIWPIFSKHSSRAPFIDQELRRYQEHSWKYVVLLVGELKTLYMW